MKRNVYAAILLSLTACVETPDSKARSESSAVKLGLNDVAIILPYKSSPGLLELAPTAFNKPAPARYAPGADALPLDGEGFVPNTVLQEISAILMDDRAIHEKENFAFGTVGNPEVEGKVTASGAENSDSPYRFVSMRLDPCANILHINGNLSSCERNIRLVFQPLHLENGKVSAIDNNVHAIYQPDERTFASFVNGVRDLRAAAGAAARDEGLSLHPVIAREGLEGPYFKGLIGLMHRYLRASSLSRIAFFGDTNTAHLGHWPMVAFNVKDGKAVRIALPKLAVQAGEETKLVQRIEGATSGFLQEPAPRGDMKPSLFPPMTPPDPAEMEGFIKAFLTEKYQAAVQVENPDKHDPFTSDCASCHMAAATRLGLAKEMRGMGLELPEADAYRSQSFNLKSDVTSEFSHQALQIFSYFKTEPKIAPRAVHDAAASADFLNRD